MSNLTITAPRRVLRVTTDCGVLRLSAPGPAALKVVREGIQGPPGTLFISTDPENTATIGGDGGIFVPSPQLSSNQW